MDLDIFHEYDLTDEIIHKKLKDLKLLIESRFNLDACLKAATISDLPRSNKTGDPTYESVAKVIDSIERIAIEVKDEADKTLTEIVRLKDKKRKIEWILMNLEDAEKRLLRMRFFERHSWGEIAREMNYSRGGLYYVYKKMLTKIRKI